MLKQFKCDRLSAKISLKQCAINYNKAKGVTFEQMWLSPGISYQWGLHGLKTHVHPNLAACQKCSLGALNAKRTENVCTVSSKSPHNLRSRVDSRHRRHATPMSDYVAKTKRIRVQLRKTHELRSRDTARVESLSFCFGHADGVSESD